jgi:DNA-binding CsgD family transcriptional regulator
VGCDTPGVPALLERDESLAFLEESLANARTDGRFVFLGGEAGVGKTALLQSFCDAVGRGVRVLWGACEPLLTPRPLGPFVDIAETVGGQLGAAVLAGARPTEVAAALLQELHGSRLTVVVLEDVHWADEATLDVITMLAPRIASAPAFVLATYRDDELDCSPHLRFVLGEVVRRPRRLKLERLSHEAVSGLAEEHCLDGDELYRSTGGNPFFVTEVLAAGGERMPATVRDAVLARAARLSEPARKLLDAVAVVPGPVDAELLDALAGELVDEVDECLGSGVLVAEGIHVSFRHELARLAIEEALAPPRRLTLHRRALAALAARPTADLDLAGLAHHADAAGDAGAVLEWAPKAAAAAAASHAHVEAAAQYARALRYASEHPSAERAVLLRSRAHECYTIGQMEAAVEAERGALDCYRQLGDPLGEGDALRSLSRLLFFAGRPAEGEPLMFEAIDLLEPLPAGHELAMAYGNVSQRRMVVGDIKAAVEWGARALELAERTGDAEAFVYALTNVGAGQMQVGESDRGRVTLERALELAREHGFDEYAGRALFSLAFWPLTNREYELVTGYLVPGLEYCSERGLESWRLYLIASSARLDLEQGRWEQAAESAAAVLRNPRSPPVARGGALAALGSIRARRGDAHARAPLEEAHAMVHQTDEPHQVAPVAAARAEAAWLVGDAQAVERVTDAALALARARGVCWAVSELAYWRHQAGVVDELADEVAGTPFGSSLQGEHTAAAARWRELGCPYEEALAMAESGEPDDVRDAIERLQRLGARPAAAILARRLRERGVRGVPRGPRPETRANAVGLTARQLQVLELLVEGLRNAEIARRLVLSERTVDHHVSAVLGKLGVRSRGEAAAAAARLGLRAPT